VQKALQGAGLWPTAQAGAAPAEAAGGRCPDAAAHRRQQASLAERLSLVRPDRDSGRRDDQIYYAQLVEEESTRTVMAGLREVIETEACSALVQRPGKPLFVTVKEGEKVDKHRLTQVGGR